MKPLLDRTLPAAGLLVVRVARLRKRFAGCASICISNPLTSVIAGRASFPWGLTATSPSCPGTDSNGEERSCRGPAHRHHLELG